MKRKPRVKVTDGNSWTEKISVILPKFSHDCVFVLCDREAASVSGKVKSVVRDTSKPVRDAVQASVLSDADLPLVLSLCMEFGEKYSDTFGFVENQVGAMARLERECLKPIEKEVDHVGK